MISIKNQNSSNTIRLVKIIFILIYCCGCLTTTNTSTETTYQESLIATYVNKTYELFKDSNLIGFASRRSSSFKLNCHLSLPRLSNHQQQNFTGNTTHHRHDRFYQIRWFKLDPNLNVRKEFVRSVNSIASTEEIDEDENEEDEAIYVLNQYGKEENATNQTRISDDAGSKMKRRRISSTLLFKFKDSSDFVRAAGLYLCRLEEKGHTFRQHLDSQYIHQISINEMTNDDQQKQQQNQQQVSVFTQPDYVRMTCSVLEASKFRLVLNISYAADYVNENTQFFYSLIDVNSQLSKARGRLSIAHVDQEPHCVYLALEGLESGTKYLLLVYARIKTQHQPPLSHTNLVLNSSMATTLTDKLSKQEASTEDDEEVHVTNKQISARRQQQIVNCELKSIESSSLDSTTSTTTSSPPHFLDINYLSANMHSLLVHLLSLSNLSSNDHKEPHLHLRRYFIDRFNLINFNSNVKQMDDFSINTDCIRQFPHSTLKFTEPLCSLDLDSSSESSSDDPENGGEDAFSVHTYVSLPSFNHDRSLRIHVASICSKQKRQQRHSAASEAVAAAAAAAAATATATATASRFSNGNANVIDLYNLSDNVKNVSHGAETLATAVSLPSLSSSSRPSTLAKTSMSSSSTTTAHKVRQSGVALKGSGAMTAIIDQCVITNEKVLKFKLESNLNEYSRLLNSHVKPVLMNSSTTNNKAYQYEIEILVPTSDPSLPKSAIRTLSTSSYYTNLTKFRMNATSAAEGHIAQIVKLNLTNAHIPSVKVVILAAGISKFSSQPFTIKTTQDSSSNREKRDKEFAFEGSKRKLVTSELHYGSLTLATFRPSNFSKSSHNNTIKAVKEKSKLNLVEEENAKEEADVYTVAYAESLSAPLDNNNLVDYLFKIKLLNENSTRLDDFELNVQCLRMNANSVNSHVNSISLNDGNNSFFGFIMTLACALVIMIVGFLICLVMKRKYGISSDYFMNFKKNFIFKTSSNANCSDSTHSKFTKKYQLPISAASIIHHHHHHSSAAIQQPHHYGPARTECFSNVTAISNTDAKSALFNCNYVRLLKQIWASNSKSIPIEKISHQQRAGGSIHITDLSLDENLNNRNNYYLSSKRKGKEGAFFSFGARLKHAKPQIYLNRLRTLVVGTNKHSKSENHSPRQSNSGDSSSTASSPLVVFAANNFLPSHQQQQHRKPQITGNNEANGKEASNMISYYSSTFTNSIKSKLNATLKIIHIVYKEDNDAIGLDVFDVYAQRMHQDGDFGFAQLYEEIMVQTKTYTFTSDVSLLESNRMKNRYSNILTYDHSRVKLTYDEKDDSFGYINANYVDGYLKPNAYIATQGPMPNTFYDFWRMICEKNCNIIVMITNVKEKGRIKCDQYWPDEGTESYGNIQVTHLQTICLAFYTKRIFTVKLKNQGGKKKSHNLNYSNNSGEMLVYQYHFTDWPDHGVPYYILPVLTFIRKSSRANPERAGPIVVHCSAGVGRTGTYIVIDAMMKQIVHRRTINVHTFLKHIRQQRNYLVQTEEQFIFIYDVLLESIKSGETELTEANCHCYVANLTRLLVCENGVVGQLLIDRQFELITEFKPNEYQVSAALMPFNASKNRIAPSSNAPLILPVNNSRVLLSRRPGLDGSEYINASYLHGCCRQDEFIVTQYPLASTKCNFWQMVWDNNATQLVVLNSDEISVESGGMFWERVGEAMHCDAFTVTLKEETFDMDFVVRDFLLQSIDEDYEFNCKMLTVSYWPDSCTPLKTTFDLINKVKSFRLHSMTLANLNNIHSNNSNAANNLLLFGSATNSHSNYANSIPPVVVLDLCGGWRAATFCALYTLQDSIQLEGVANVYELAKLYHLKRPNVWSNKNNILFLYEAVEYIFDEIHQISVNSNTTTHTQVNKNYYNVVMPSQLANNAGGGNHSSLLILPSSGPAVVTATSAPLTSTLPPQIGLGSNGVFKSLKSSQNHQRNSSSVSSSNNQQHTTLMMNSAEIGARLHHFHNHIDQSRRGSLNPSSPGLVIPLSPSDHSTPQRQATSQQQRPQHWSKLQTVNNSIRKNIGELPRFIRRNMLNNSRSSNQNGNELTSPPLTTRSSLSSYRRAMRLVASVKVKSESFKQRLGFGANSANSSTETACSAVYAVQHSMQCLEPPKPSVALSMQSNAEPVSVANISSRSSRSSRSSSKTTSTSSSQEETTLQNECGDLRSPNRLAHPSSPPPPKAPNSSSSSNSNSIAKINIMSSPTAAAVVGAKSIIYREKLP